jgi:uncharacterized protein YkwD
MSEPTELDQYLIELINRARLDPVREAARLGIDLNQGLSQGKIGTAPKQPLAFDPDLTDSARGHSKWMLDKDVFSHTGVNGSNPGDRIEAEGYQLTGSWRWGENISWRGSMGTAENQMKSIETQSDSLFKSSGHRMNMLNDDFREIGTGILSGQFKQYNALMVTENFGKTGNAVLLTGVAYDDLNNNDFYTPGEGRSGIKVEATLQGATKPVTLSDTTGAAGGYDIALAPGTYSVKFSGGGLAAPVIQTVTLGNENEKLDLIDPKDVKAPAVAKAAGGTQAVDAEVAGASESAPISALIELVRESGDKLDFSALTDHVRDGTPLPDVWVETLHRGEEILKTVDTDAFADDLAHYIDLLGVRDTYHRFDELVGA